VKIQKPSSVHRKPVGRPKCIPELAQALWQEVPPSLQSTSFPFLFFLLFLGMRGGVNKNDQRMVASHYHWKQWGMKVLKTILFLYSFRLSVKLFSYVCASSYTCVYIVTLKKSVRGKTSHTWTETVCCQLSTHIAFLWLHYSKSHKIKLTPPYCSRAHRCWVIRYVCIPCVF
jgi:hypothetical protein